MSCEKLVKTESGFFEAVGDAGAGAVTLDEESVRNQSLDRLPDRDARQAEADGEVAFARDRRSRRQHLPFDRGAQRLLDPPVERGRARRIEPRVPLEETDERLDLLDRFDDRGPVAHRHEFPSLRSRHYGRNCRVGKAKRAHRFAGGGTLRLPTLHWRG